ncbi:LamG domain-containing protein [Paractinoplanes durhamensis]|uniref:LamG domain-containing protein n=1 Tax=Paractinoplanes durhamensis TaxID=113563 RepID=UPI003636A6F7
MTGRSGQALDLNGSTGYAAIPGGILAGAANFSVALWVRIDTVATWSRLFDLGTGTGAYMFLTPRSSAGTARFAITTAGSGGEQRIDGPAALPTGAWTHVAVTRSGGLGVLYVNGTEVARNAALTATLTSTTQNWLGRSQYADPYLDGALDNVRFYSRALTAAEVTTLATNGQ